MVQETTQEKVINKVFEVDEYDVGYGRTVHREYEVYAVPLDKKTLRRVEVKKRTYYLWPEAGNYYSYNVVMKIDEDGRVEIQGYIISSSNIVNIAYIKLDDYSGETPGFLWRDEVEKIKSIDDLKEYLNNMIGWLKDFVDTFSL